VAGNLTGVLTDAFASVAVAIVALITFRDDLRARLRATTPKGIPLLTEAAAMIASYLAVERDLGRIAADADIGTLAPTLLGASHLLFADRTGAAPEPEAVRKLVTAVIAGVIRDDIPDPRSPARRRDCWYPVGVRFIRCGCRDHAHGTT
jgi:hypothetical protein